MSIKAAKLKKGGIRVGSDSKTRYDGSEFDRKEVGDDKVGKKVQKTFKSKKLFKSKKMIGSDFFTTGARLVFIELRQAFLKAPIVYHFDPECHI